VQSGAPACQELTDGRLRGKRLEQLDVSVTDVQKRCVNALLGHRLAVYERHPEHIAIQHKRRVDVLDGDADVVDYRQHPVGA
jgi:hypothetical protein